MKKIVLFSTMVMLSFLSCTKENSQFASFSDVNNLVSSNTTQSLTSAGCDDIILNCFMSGQNWNFDLNEAIRASRAYFECVASSQPNLDCSGRRNFTINKLEASETVNGGLRYLLNGTLEERKQNLLNDCKAMYSQTYLKYAPNVKIKVGGLSGLSEVFNNGLPAGILTKIGLDFQTCKINFAPAGGPM